MQLNNYKSINEEMYNFIKSEQSRDQAGISKSNVKGWHSKDFNLEIDQSQKFISFILPHNRTSNGGYGLGKRKTDS